MDLGIKSAVKIARSVLFEATAACTDLERSKEKYLLISPRPHVYYFLRGISKTCLSGNRAGLLKLIFLAVLNPPH